MRVKNFSTCINARCSLYGQKMKDVGYGYVCLGCGHFHGYFRRTGRTA